MSQTLLLSDDLLRQAQLIGGEIEPEFDRQTSTSESLPFYSVVGKNSKDSSYRGLMDGKSVEVSRAGMFRRKNEEGEPEYYEALELVIIDARTSYTLFEDNQPVARGISTKGFFDPVWTDGKFGVGASVETCPYFRWYWEKNGGKEGRVFDPDTGKVITKEDLASSALQLWCWNLSVDEYCIVQFSAGAIRHYKDAVRAIEMQGVKTHALLWKIATAQHDNGASAAPTYAPLLEPLRVLDADEFKRAQAKRTELVSKALALAPFEAQTALPPAAPTKSAFSDVPSTGSISVPNDPFVTA
jgi:hypothetical protein